MGGADRRYIVHVPPRSTARPALPVVLMLHGRNETARDAMRATGWARKADAAGFLAVFPEAILRDPSQPPAPRNPRIWHADSGPQAVDDVGFLNALLDDLQARFSVDRRRIFVTGASAGAAMTYRLGLELSGRLAAVAPLAGYLRFAERRLDRQVSLLFIIGTADPIFPLEGGETQMPWGTAQKPKVLEAVFAWARMLNCQAKPAVIENRDGVRGVRYASGAQGAEVRYYTVDGLGHVWPGGARLLPEQIAGKPSDKLDATSVIWSFFARHPGA